MLKPDRRSGFIAVEPKYTSILAGRVEERSLKAVKRALKADVNDNKDTKKRLRRFLILANFPLKIP